MTTFEGVMLSFPEVVKIVICHFVIFEKKRGCQTSIYLYIYINI